ncbi:MAG: transposase [Candidatus Omnitrophica bacterium]|nr:transposase [Candidatus Omnitrophota bacterium]
MPRVGRVIPVNAAAHIMCRGNNKQVIFHSDKDKLQYYLFLNKFKDENKIAVFHYCLMNSHIHLIVFASAETRLSRFMKQVNLSYFSYYSRKYGYVGHLWQGRFKSKIIERDEYLLQCGKYIELNPVRAGMVNFPQEYKFSSYNYYSIGAYDPLITPNPAYLGLSDFQQSRRKQYLEFILDSSIIKTILLISDKRKDKNINKIE